MSQAKLKIAHGPKTRPPVFTHSITEQPQDQNPTLSPANNLLLLNNKKLAPAQRQTLARDIGKHFGNRQLQRLVNSSTQETNDTLEVLPVIHPTLRQGATGEEVIHLQRRLNINGADLVEDGIWGLKTQTALITFQRTHDLVPDGVAGPKTWTSLEANPPNVDDQEQGLEPNPTKGTANSLADGGGSAKAKSLTAGGNSTGTSPEPTLTSLAPLGFGQFASFVTAGFLDKDAALLLHAMATASPFSWAQDSAQFVFDELSSGDLLGMVKAADKEKLVNKAPAKFHKDIREAAVSEGGAIYVPMTDKQSSRGWVLLGDGLLTPTGSLRFPMLVLSHELNHHRNRKIADFMEAEPAADVNNAREYADTKIAKKFEKEGAGLPHIRKQYVVEIVARHVAWHVAQQFDTKIAKSQSIEKIMPAPGQLFKALFDFAKGDPGAYHDNGYIPALAAQGDAVLGKQVAMWMRNAARMEFHNLAVTSDAVGRFFIIEAALAEAAGFIPSGKGDGLA